MIEFNGYLTGTSQKFFCKQIIKLQQKIILFTLIPIFVILIIVFYLMFDVIALYPEVIISEIILSALALLLPNIQTKKKKKKSHSKKYAKRLLIITKITRMIQVGIEILILCLLNGIGIMVFIIGI